MNKKQVQQRVLQNGSTLDLNKFEWNEKEKVFSTLEDNLVINFQNVNGCTFDTGSDCTFKTGFDCMFKTDSGCTFKTGFDCMFKTDSDCTFKTDSGCTFKTDSDCTFKTDSGCTFKTDSGCTFKTDSGCTFDTDSDCTFDTGSDCTFDTGSDCTFRTGKNCVAVRRDVYEVIELIEGQKIKLNAYDIPGYTILSDKVKIICEGKEVEISRESAKALGLIQLERSEWSRKHE